MLTEKGLSHSRGLITKGVEGLKKELTFKVRSPSNELEGLPFYVPGMGHFSRNIDFFA